MSYDQRRQSQQHNPLNHIGTGGDPRSRGQQSSPAGGGASSLAPVKRSMMPGPSNDMSGLQVSVDSKSRAAISAGAPGFGGISARGSGSFGASATLGLGLMVLVGFILWRQSG